jgi:hypothetical protein
MKIKSARILLLVLVFFEFGGITLAQSMLAETTTAWHNGEFHVDVAGVIGRSSIVLGQPNLDADEAMPPGQWTAWRRHLVGAGSHCATKSERYSAGPLVARRGRDSRTLGFDTSEGLCGTARSVRWRVSGARRRNDRNRLRAAALPGNLYQRDC